MKIKDVRPCNKDRIIEYLGKLPNDEVYLAKEVAEKLGIPGNSFRNATLSPEARNYRTALGKLSYFGNPVAIKAFKARFKLS